MNIAKNIQKFRTQKGLTQRQFAKLSGITYSTITKLESNAYQNPTIETLLRIAESLAIPVGELIDIERSVSKESGNSRFTFIDLFAGVGGIRLAFSRHGGKSVFSSEIDTFAAKTYEANFNEIPTGDITKVSEADIPDHDILLGGFPCQPFSIAGVSKKNSMGVKHGFLDETKGTLFFHIARIVKQKRPKVLFLENVKNLMSHDKGNTFKVVIDTLKELDYTPYYKVCDGKYFVPQHRERTIIVAFDNHYFQGGENFKFPEFPKDNNLKIKSILEKEVDDKYTLSDKLWNYLQAHAAKHKAKGNGFGFGLVDLDGIARTLSARYYKDGSEILIPQKGKAPRRLTPRECARLQGFPDDFIIPVSDTQAYKQFGNSVVVPMMEYLADSVIRSLTTYKCQKKQSQGKPSSLLQAVN
jgi:DNA (cytosine-5)-methyltransferase 1